MCWGGSRRMPGRVGGRGRGRIPGEKGLVARRSLGLHDVSGIYEDKPKSEFQFNRCAMVAGTCSRIAYMEEVNIAFYHVTDQMEEGNENIHPAGWLGEASWGRVRQGGCR